MENANGEDREDRRRVHLQLHEGRLPLQSLHLQELQLLKPPRAAPITGCGPPTAAEIARPIGPTAPFIVNAATCGSWSELTFIMTQKQNHVRPGLTALGAVLAISSTTALAQSVPPASDTTTAPATTATPPASDSTTTAPAPATDTQTSAPAADTAAPSPAKPVRAKSVAKPVRAAAAAAPAPGPVKASVPSPKAAPAVPPRVATGTEKIVTPNPIVKTAEPAVAPVQFAQPKNTNDWSSLSNDINPAAAAGALAVVALAGAGIGLRRRRRRLDEEEEAAQWDESDAVEPDAEMQPAWAAAAPMAVAERQSETIGENRLPNGFDLSRFGPHVQAAYRGPTEDNPSLSLRHRLRRAAAMDQMERRAAERTDSAPVAEEPVAAEKPFMFANGDSVKFSRSSEESELTH